ncbi:MAG TPA: 30S ribosomal protein S5 [Verrucomicrobiae bacterium]|nr:30S ribosomal protein S5 [Verrucomicrobiae bacterium]
MENENAPVEANVTTPETAAETPAAAAAAAPEAPQQQPSGHGRGPRGTGRGRRRQDSHEPSFGPQGEELTEKVVFINRSAKVVKGGRRFNFSALVVVGDRKGKVGVGLGKAGEVADAIRKGGEMARNRMLPVRLQDATIPHEVFSHYCGARVLLRPASPGTGIIAGPTVRAVLESAGIKDILSKSLGSKNAANVVKATLEALLSLRLREDIYKGRGLQMRKHAAKIETSAPAAEAGPVPAAPAAA